MIGVIMTIDIGALATAVSVSLRQCSLHSSVRHAKNHKRVDRREYVSGHVELTNKQVHSNLLGITYYQVLHIIR